MQTNALAGGNLLKRRTQEILKNRYTTLFVILAAEVIFFAVSAPYFLSIGNVMGVLRQISEIGMIAIPLTYLLIAGHMDLSVGSIIGISGVICGVLLRGGYPIPLAILLGILSGGAVGLLNGFLIGILKIQGLVVTIGMQVMVRGLCYIVTQGRAVSGYPQAFFFLGSGTVLGIPVSVLVLFVLAVCAALLLQRGYIGRNLFAIGNNQNTAAYSGVRVGKAKLLLFTFCGLISAIASIFLISRISSAEATLGSGYELDVITAALLGGVDINGGSGKLPAALMGILIIGVLRNGLNLMGMSVIYQSIVLGVLLLLAVVRPQKRSSHK